MADEVSALSQFHQTAIYISFVVINNWLSLKLLIKIKSTNKLMAFQIKIKLLKKKNYNEKIDWKYKNKNFLILFDFSIFFINFFYFYKINEYNIIDAKNVKIHDNLTY